MPVPQSMFKQITPRLPWTDRLPKTATLLKFIAFMALVVIGALIGFLSVLYYAGFE